MPYPHAGGHQAHNVAPYVAGGAAVAIEDAACTPERLLAEIRAIVNDVVRWRSMADASRRLGRPDAADRVVELIEQVARARVTGTA